MLADLARLGLPRRSVRGFSPACEGGRNSRWFDALLTVAQKIATSRSASTSARLAPPRAGSIRARRSPSLFAAGFNAVVPRACARRRRSRNQWRGRSRRGRTGDRDDPCDRAHMKRRDHAAKTADHAATYGRRGSPVRRAIASRPSLPELRASIRIHLDFAARLALNFGVVPVGSVGETVLR